MIDTLSEEMRTWTDTEDYVPPSERTIAEWIEEVEELEAMINDYRRRLEWAQL